MATNNTWTPLSKSSFFQSCLLVFVDMFFVALLSSFLLEERRLWTVFFAEWDNLNFPDILMILCCQLIKIENQRKERHNFNNSIKSSLYRCWKCAVPTLFMYLFWLKMMDGLEDSVVSSGEMLGHRLSQIRQWLESLETVVSWIIIIIITFIYPSFKNIYNGFTIL